MPPTTLPPLSLSLPGPRTCPLRLGECDVSERQQAYRDTIPAGACTQCPTWTSVVRT